MNGPRYALTEDELAAFHELGISQPHEHPLLAADSTFGDRVMTAFRSLAPRLAWPGETAAESAERLDSGRMWFQSTFTVLAEVWALASHPAVVDKVRSILGPDFLLWGSSVLSKAPGDVHAWHIDTQDWEGVGVFTGLRGLTKGSVLKAIARSHRFDVPPARALGVSEDPYKRLSGGPLLSDDRLVLEAARTRDPKCEILEYDMTDGQFYLFHHRLWHGSRNVTNMARTAVTFFFARPNADVRIPLSFHDIEWYAKKPPCVLVSGEDRFGRNLLVAPPAIARAS